MEVRTRTTKTQVFAGIILAVVFATYVYFTSRTLWVLSGASHMVTLWEFSLLLPSAVIVIWVLKPRVIVYYGDEK